MNCSVIIVSYNTKKLTLQALKSVFASVQSHASIEVIVVDNNSSDDTIPAIQKEYGHRVHIIKNRDNRGFAAANNQAIQIARGKYILLLNSDTIVTENAIERMGMALEQHPSYGIVSCRLLNEDGSYQSQGGALPTLLNVSSWWLWPLPGIMPGISPYQNPQVIPSTEHTQDIIASGWVGGTAMMIRRSVIDKIGLLDEGIFMYAEDVDYCLRAHTQGFLIGIVPSASIVHLGSASSGSLNAKRGEITGLLYVFKKHMSAVNVFLLRLILIIGSVLRYILFGILGNKKEARRLYQTILSVAVQ